MIVHRPKDPFNLVSLQAQLARFSEEEVKTYTYGLAEISENEELVTTEAGVPMRLTEEMVRLKLLAEQVAEEHNQLVESKTSIEAENQQDRIAAEHLLLHRLEAMKALNNTLLEMFWLSVRDYTGWSCGDGKIGIRRGGVIVKVEQAPAYKSFGDFLNAMINLSD